MRDSVLSVMVLKHQDHTSPAEKPREDAVPWSLMETVEVSQMQICQTNQLILIREVFHLLRKA